MSVLRGSWNSRRWKEEKKRRVAELHGKLALVLKAWRVIKTLFLGKRHVSGFTVRF